MKRLLFSVLMFQMAAPGCAQQKQAVHKGYAFFSMAHPGNIPVDDQGNPEYRSDTVYQVYLETTHKNPREVQVVLDGKRFQAVPVSIDEVAVGTRQADGKEVVLRPKPGFQLWQLDLAPGTRGGTSNRIIWQDSRGKSVSVPLQRPVELHSREHY